MIVLLYGARREIPVSYTHLDVYKRQDHIHLSVAIPPKISIANFMGYLKGKSTLMLYDRPVSYTHLDVYKRQLVSRA